MVGIFYYRGFGTNTNKNEALEWYMKANQKNSSFEIGWYYCYGDGIEKDCKKAHEYYQLAAKNDSNIALYNLAYCYKYGIGTKKDSSKAFDLCKKSAERGFIPSQYWLAMSQENKSEALRWFKLYQENGIIDVSDKIKREQLQESNNYLQNQLRKIEELISQQQSLEKKD
jgi:TPR repeat protein